MEPLLSLFVTAPIAAPSSSRLFCYTQSIPPASHDFLKPATSSDRSSGVQDIAHRRRGRRGQRRSQQTERLHVEQPDHGNWLSIRLTPSTVYFGAVTRSDDAGRPENRRYHLRSHFARPARRLDVGLSPSSRASPNSATTKLRVMQHRSALGKTRDDAIGVVTTSDP